MTIAALTMAKTPQTDQQWMREVCHELCIAGNLANCQRKLATKFEAIKAREEEKKRKEEERRLEISTKTRNNLSRLLDRKRAENKDELIR